MNSKTIIVLRKDQYGTMVYYPVCDASHLFARIAKTKTLTTENLTNIKQLGYTIQVTYPAMNQTELRFADV